MKIRIRPLEAGETGSLLSFWAAAGATTSLTDTEEELERALRHSHLAYFVAEAEGRIVGSIFAGFDGWRGNIYRLAVHPDCRRQGIARDLVRSAEARFAAWGVRRVTCLVENDHADAVGFWKGIGYGHDTRISRYVRTL